MTSLFAFLRQPYPCDESGARTLWRAALIGAFIGAFLLLFQPFGLDDWSTPYKTLWIGGFGVVTFGVMAFVSSVTPRLFPRYFSEARWTTGRQIAFILTHILLIAVANRLYVGWMLDVSLSGGWGWMLSITFLIGIFPAVGVVLANYITQLRRYTREADALSAQMPPSNPSATTPVVPPSADAARLMLTADNEKDMLTLAAADLLAIESSDNYCTVFLRKEGRVTKELIRSSLSRLEAQLSQQLPGADAGNVPVRCHRSYVVNLSAVERVSGNAQGYKLHLAGGQLVVPVARKYNDTLVKGLKAV